jgi:hypothetical protein
MRKYKIANTWHYVYEGIEEVPQDLLVTPDWRDGEIGDWILSDDECVIQVLRKGEMKTAKGRNKVRGYIGTCTGTFTTDKKTRMDTSKRINIYSFGGKHRQDILLDRTTLSQSEELFVQYLTSGMSPREAYLKAYPTNKPGYANIMAGKLVKTERIKTAMKEELKPVLESLGIDETYILNGIKKTVEFADKEDVKLRALFKLADIMDMEDKNSAKVTQISGAVFKGFTDGMIEEAERPKEITGETT